MNDINKVINNPLYLPAGWFNAGACIDDQSADIFLIAGGRGIGKTYGFIKEFIERKILFVLMRRTEVEASLQLTEDTSSLFPVLRDMGLDEASGHVITFRKIGKGKITFVYLDGEELCCIIALSTSTILRGVDLERYTAVLFDEFIPEPHVRSLPKEGLAFNNAIETIGRNRELKGLPPLRVYCIGNSFDIANPIFIYEDMVSPAELLLMNGQEVYRRGNKCLILCQYSPISKLKEGTSLYKDVSKEFKDIALGNKFHLNDFTNIARRNIKQFRIICKAGDIYIYKHKSDREWYITFTPAETKEIYKNTDADLTRFRRKHHRLYIAYLDGHVKFEKYECLALFEQYYKM